MLVSQALGRSSPRLTRPLSFLHVAPAALTGCARGCSFLARSERPLRLFTFPIRVNP